MMRLPLGAWCPFEKGKVGKGGRAPRCWLYSYSTYVHYITYVPMSTRKKMNSQKDVMDRNSQAVTERELALKARNLISRLPLYLRILPQPSLVKIHRAVGQKE